MNVDQIHATLMREVARADRTQRPLCLVLIETIQKKSAMDAGRGISRMTAKRARATDIVGWYDGEHCCAILPETDREGGRTFARALNQIIVGHGFDTKIQIHTYPESDDDHQSGSESPAVLPGPTIQIDLSSPSKAVLHRLQDANRPSRRGDLQSPVTRMLVRPTPFWKRAFDILGAIVALMLFSPIMLLAAVGVKLTSSGPIVFTQERNGLGGKPFTIFKFRTMVIHAETLKADLLNRSEQDGPAFKLKRDPRVTSIGRLLRKTSIDELPQLFNVLRGDMSLVGPRPLPCNESFACLPWQRRRLDVVPGLTCIWQVSGRSTVSFTEWVRMDRAYISRRSIWRDVKILFRTIPAVLLQRGAH